MYPSAYVCPLARAWHRHRHQHRQFPVLFSFSSDSGQRKLVQSSKMAKKSGAEVGPIDATSLGMSGSFDFRIAPWFLNRLKAGRAVVSAAYCKLSMINKNAPVNISTANNLPNNFSLMDCLVNKGAWKSLLEVVDWIFRKFSSHFYLKFPTIMLCRES